MSDSENPEVAEHHSEGESESLNRIELNFSGPWENLRILWHYFLLQLN